MISFVALPDTESLLWNSFHSVTRQSFDFMYSNWRVDMGHDAGAQLLFIFYTYLRSMASSNM